MDLQRDLPATPYCRRSCLLLHPPHSRITMQGLLTLFPLPYVVSVVGAWLIILENWHKGILVVTPSSQNPTLLRAEKEFCHYLQWEIDCILNLKGNAIVHKKKCSSSLISKLKCLITVRSDKIFTHHSLVFKARLEKLPTTASSVHGGKRKSSTSVPKLFRVSPKTGSGSQVALSLQLLIGSFLLALSQWTSMKLPVYSWFSGWGASSAPVDNEINGCWTFR